MLMDLRPQSINGKLAQEILDQAGITVSKSTLPFDTEKIILGGGIRVGSPAVTTRGMREEEMMEIADLIHRALQAKDDDRALETVRSDVRALTSRYPLPG
jgi:glycine hydroxymethyltransferase